jgi:single-strand DNA-binding protein
MALPYVIVNGRLTEDPIVKEINGDNVLNYRVAANQRKQNEQGEWVDANTTYLDGSLWGKGATNASLKKGDTVIITGELKQRSYETKEGEKRTVYEIATESIGQAVKKY